MFRENYNLLWDLGIFTLLTIFMLGFSVVTFFFSKKFFTKLINKENNEYIGLLIGSVSAIYGFFLGFILINLWQDYDRLELLINQEGERLAIITYNSFALPSAIQNPFLDEIGQYIKATVEGDWPSLQRGEPAVKTRISAANLYNILQSYTLETRTEITFYEEIVKELNELVKGRAGWVKFVKSSLIDPLRFILLFGFFIIIFLVSLIDIKIFTYNCFFPR